MPYPLAADDRANEHPTASTAGPITAYALYSVFRRVPGAPTTPIADETAAAAELGQVIEVAGHGDPAAHVRGLYDVSGFRHDGELLVWLHGAEPAALQRTLRAIRRTALIRPLEPTWQAVGVHRAAEFNPRHMPAFMLGREPRGWVTVYPFVRSYDWYLLPPEERSRLLAEHGRRGAAFTTVLANTIAAFGISDYEWLLALEDDDPIRLVDLMRDLRQTEARRHVRLETPFYTGRRIDAAEVPEVLR